MSHSTHLQQAFIEQLGPQYQLIELFAHLPDVYFFAKDKHGRFMIVNAVEANLHGFRDPIHMVGKTDFDFHPQHLAQQYVAEDARVMASRETIPNQVWLVHDHRGRLKWYISTKTPLISTTGDVIGIAGVMRDFDRALPLQKPIQNLEQTLTYVLENYGRKIDVHFLAEMSGLSISQYDRRFKQLFHMTPQQYILRVRLHAAGHSLLNSNASLAAIATDSGFYDQSYFTKQFRKWSGLTPRDYRRQNQNRSATSISPEVNIGLPGDK